MEINQEEKGGIYFPAQKSALDRDAAWSNENIMDFQSLVLGSISRENLAKDET